MSENEERFYLLITDILKLEEEYEKVEYKYSILLFQFKRFGKESYAKTKSTNLECEIANSKIKVLWRQLFKLEHSPELGEYYSLYLERSKLIKELYNLNTKIGCINCIRVFGSLDNKKVDKKMLKKLNNLKKERDLVILLGEELNVKMSNLQFA